MTLSETSTRQAETPAGAPVRRAAGVRPSRGANKPNGQWKVDGTAPLNANEEWKQQDGGLAVL